MFKCRRCDSKVDDRVLCNECKKESNSKMSLMRIKSTRRKGFKYKQWANLVKERDNFKCQHCGCTDLDRLQAHHIVPWEDSIELRFELSNGLTLCRICHTKEDRRIKPLKAWNKGKKLSAEHRRKLSEAKIGKDPWNKEKKGIPSPKKGLPGKKHTKESKTKISAFTKGRSWIIDEDSGKRKWIDRQ